MAWARLTAAITIGATAAGGSAPAAAGPQPTAVSAAGPRTALGEGPVTVRLVTGDQVTVTRVSAHRRTASVRPGPGRGHIPFRTLEQGDGSLTVLPADAEALVAAGTLDRRLFDVAALIDQGYDETRTPALPLIVFSRPVADGAAATAQATAAAGATADRLATFHTAGPSRSLPSIDARSLRVGGDDLGAFWKALTSAGSSDARRITDTPRIALDGKVTASLDRSTAQIGAPARWKAGYEGQGVKVAVLDTGVDAAHPDLAGRIAAAENFAGGRGTDDRFGHGTHVAATVGGTGAAAGGTRRGVAPRAELLIGKVLGDDGSGSESQVIDGMEWATASGADIVNMSLGADILTDGTDPMSEAVNALSAATDTLFVVAAGNAGPGATTVGSPGAADAALTVGAVDRDDTLADFSSRGPRYRDGAAKPDITAPGVGIVAARASGTAMGSPVDAHYTAASGTSMATPHVAGAAALLAQQHPDWDARRLKDALISTARTQPGTKVSEQGGGRVDLTAAAGPVTATGTVVLDPLVPGRGTTRQKATVRYTNTGDRPVDLRLDVRLATDTGRRLPDGVVTPGTETVRVGPGATAEVPLDVTPGTAARGKYFGYVTATAADGTTVAHTTLSLLVRAPEHRLTVVVRDRDGHVMPGVLPNIWGAEGFVDYTDRDAAVATVEEGTYFLNASFAYSAEDGEEVRELFAPEVKVTKDTTVTLNAADATEVEIRTPRPAEQRGLLNVNWRRELDGYRWSWGSMYFDAVKHVYASPSPQVTDGSFEFSTRWQLTAPQLRAEVAGGAVRFTPYYEPTSPAFGDGGARLQAVDAGSTAAPDFRAARGKLAVLEYESDPGDAMLARAKAAGVKAVLLVWPRGQTVWSWWQPDGDREPLPVLRAPHTQGTALLARVRKGRSAVVHFSGTVRSPYLYDVMQVATGSVPERIVHTVSERESAMIRATYTRTGDSAWASEQRFGWRPYQETAWNNETSRYVPVGRERLEYVTAGDTLWSHTVHHNVVPDPHRRLQVGMRDLPHTYRPGQRGTERWFSGPVRPSIPVGAPWPSVRHGDTLSVHIPEFTDSAPDHWSFAEVADFGGGIGARDGQEPVSDTAEAVLYRDGEQVFSSQHGMWGDVEVPGGAADYRLDLRTSRTSDDWRFGTGTRTSWTFSSATETEETELPLLQVDYAVPVDAGNAVGPQRRHTVGIGVRMQDGMAAPRGVSVRLETSYDDGRTWTRARTTRVSTGGFTATVERPSRVHGDAAVTLRVTATDAAGNSVRQTIDRAYLHPGSAS
ncbi:S8 family serine peptidase [Streptomyces justiciae]|uniref:S8 family serine peptidase n=1 Tax=Streptomyces justiciae TaxID=2780140 RepID=A0ABU3M2L5_9ACTN|nr:S8 family serine peptidase [Streptomyces justiciae]MDT7845665.1 S8 family serine peptidase [Streptomyces justiciae]